MSSVTTTPQDIAALIAADAPTAEHGWLATSRRTAVARAAALGLPTREDEEWRYTNPAPVIGAACTLADDSTFEGEVADTDDLDLEAAAKLVFVDGRFAPALSNIGSLPSGVHLTPLHGDLGQASGTVDQILAAGVADARDGFEALGAGLATGGIVLRLDENALLEKPILVVHRSTEAGSATLVAPNMIVIAAANSEATIIEDHCGAASGGVTLARGDIRADRDARIEHAVLIREPVERHHISTLRLVQQGGGFVRSHKVLLGGAIVRNNLHVTIEGEHAETALNGIFVPEGTQHHDTHLRVEHTAPNCHSRQFYKGMLADRSRGVFTGRIWVQDVAQKTDAIQSNSNLLLSKTAQVTAKPQLEIYADDVRCTHGATSGMFDEDALFYLRARGVPEKTARLLLLHAFAGENIDRIAHEGFREAVRSLIFAKLDAALDR